MESLQEIHPKHCVLPGQAICCTLISAQSPDNGWSKEVCLHGNVIFVFILFQILDLFVDAITNATIIATVIGRCVLVHVG